MKRITYICNRCGKEKVGHPCVDIPLGERVINDVGWVRIQSKTGFKRDLDLCEDCLKSFAGWFANSKPCDISEILQHMN